MAITRGQLYSNLSANNILWADFTLNMDVHPDTGDLFLITNINAINTSLKNIVKTNTNERFYNPSFGGNLDASLFALNENNTYYIMQSRIQNAIATYETRINLLSVVVNGSGQNGVIITVQYSLQTNPTPQTLKIFIAKVR